MTHGAASAQRCRTSAGIHRPSQHALPRRTTRASQYATGIHGAASASHYASIQAWGHPLHATQPLDAHGSSREAGAKSHPDALARPLKQAAGERQAADGRAQAGATRRTADFLLLKWRAAVAAVAAWAATASSMTETSPTAQTRR